MDDTVSVAAPCRDVTVGEIEHLHEHGWVKLGAFVDPGALAGVLDVAREQMGDDGDGNPLHPFVEAAVAEGGAGAQYFNAHSAGGVGNPVLRPVIEQVGTTAKRMLRRRNPDGSALGVRVTASFVAVRKAVEH